METMLGWQLDEKDEMEVIPDDWEFGNLPEVCFECHRLEIGDKICLEILLSNGGTQFYDVEVVDVKVWITFEENGKIADTLQWVSIRG